MDTIGLRKPENLQVRILPGALRRCGETGKRTSLSSWLLSGIAGSSPATFTGHTSKRGRCVPQNLFLLEAIDCDLALVGTISPSPES